MTGEARSKVVSCSNAGHIFAFELFYDAGLGVIALKNYKYEKYSFCYKKWRKIKKL